MRKTTTRLTAGTVVRLASLASVLTLMSGCAGVLPLPVTSSKPEHGRKIDRAQVAWVGGWRGFLVAFDDQDFVTAAAFKKLSCRHPLHEHLNRWVAKLPRTALRDRAREIADTR